MVSVLAVMAMVAAMVMPAFAEAQGKGPGDCLVPGTLFSKTAKFEGPNNNPFGGSDSDFTPGGAVKLVCAPGQQ
jgi:hypothetical protein